MFNLKWACPGSELVADLKDVQRPENLVINRVSQVTGVFPDADHVCPVSAVNRFDHVKNQLNADHGGFKAATTAFSNDVRSLRIPELAEVRVDLVGQSNLHLRHHPSCHR